ncbi:pentatricopeptide repeat-containing protein At2g22410, mitochondrial-like [Magnolia sinica]|uniref:pentatricopeptide repeat-containing protein At2g22410, mitochondrial-like n=1 Tax=Magnolia sinica TaxID=86752 RepID=UPI00265A6411|nr:pentatricopeptide repeat-containing protein At2g22410, mitochondrial-like [Magnolia sinica]
MIITGRARRPPAISHLLRSLVDLDTCNLPYALAIFRQIPGPTSFLWNTIIRDCSRHGAPQESISLYLEMCRNSVVPDNYTFQFLFKACALCFSFRAGQAIHGNYIKVVDVSDVFVGNSLIHMYSEFGWVDVARRVFDEMGQKNVVSWTVMVGGYVKIGDMGEARRVFDEMPERNVVSWTSMIAGYSQNDLAEEAVGFFKRIVVDGVKPDAVAMISVLSACTRLGDLDLGKWVHQFVDRERINITQKLGVALIDMYTECGDVNAARQVFDRMVWKIVAAWNAMIDGYCKLGDFESARLLYNQMGQRDLITFNSMITGYIQSSSFMEALLLFAELWVLDLKPDKFTMVGLLITCGNLGALNQGKCLHTLILESLIESDVFLGTALVDMYAKCGSIDQAILVFNRMHEKDVLAWTAMISGLAMHGDGKSALAHFSMMQKEGIQPNRVTYIGVLNGCSHSGLVQEGWQHFSEMTSLYNIEPEVEHYGCMVDLLGRAGYLEEADELIQNMQMEPNAVIWGSLLGASRVYNNVTFAEKAAKHLLVLEPHKDAVYVLLYNVYASSGRWANATQIRGMMEEKGIKKIAGCSSIVVDGKIHEFTAGDRSHSQFEEI